MTIFASSIKILIIGNFAVNYRPNLLIQYLADNSIEYKHIDKTKYAIRSIKYNMIFKVWKKLYNRFIQSIYFVFELLLITQYDVVYILPMNNDKIIRLKWIQLLNKKLIIDYYVSLYNTYVNDRKTVQHGSRKAKRLYKLDKYAFKYSTHIIFLNENEKKYYSDLSGMSCKNALIIPLCVSERHIAKLPYLTTSNNIPNICWWGTFLQLHGLDNIIEAAYILNSQHFRAKFYLFGVKNGKEIEYIQLINNKGLDEYVTLRTDLDFSNGLIEFLIDSCDLALGQFGTNRKAANVLVNKIVDAASMQIPVLTSNNPAVYEFFDDDSILTCSPDALDIANSIKRAFSNNTELIRKAKASNLIYKNNFCPKNFYQRLDNLFKSVLI